MAEKYIKGGYRKAKERRSNKGERREKRK